VSWKSLNAEEKKLPEKMEEEIPVENAVKKESENNAPVAA